MEVENQEKLEDVAVRVRDADRAAGATVFGSEPDRESVMLGMEQWAAVRQRRDAGEAVSQIARDLGVDRKTVRRCLRQETWRPYVRQVLSPTLLDVHRAWLAERAPQVRYSARISWQELRAQRGFEGSYEVVKLAVRPLRSEASAASLAQRRFETGPGEQAQVSFFFEASRTSAKMRGLTL